MSALDITSPEKWRRLKAIIAEALDEPPDERAMVADRACGDDLALRREVGALLHAAEQAGDDPIRATLDAELVGRYAVEREIGRGGMAVVYLARDLKHAPWSPSRCCAPISPR